MIYNDENGQSVIITEWIEFEELKNAKEKLEIYYNFQSTGR